MKLNAMQQDLLLLLAWLALQCGQARRAIDLLELQLQVRPEHVEARRMLLVALLEAGDGVAALAHCAHLRSQGERAATLWFCQSRAHQLNGQSAAARDTYEHYLKQKGVDEQAV